MKILLVAATEGEIFPLKSIISASHQLDFLITGPGMVATVYELTRNLSNNKYDLAINCGLAGSFDRSIPLGEVVNVTEDILSELGAENDDEFLDLAEIGLDGKNKFQINHDKWLNSKPYRNVKSITVNMVHGNEASIDKVKHRLNPQIETMEGAAFHFVCEKENLSSIQLRAISNYVEKRNKGAWNIPLALVNLKNEVEFFIQHLQE